jgi:hypothetical protein
MITPRGKGIKIIYNEKKMIHFIILGNENISPDSIFKLKLYDYLGPGKLIFEKNDLLEKYTNKIKKRFEDSYYILLEDFFTDLLEFLTT